MFKIVLFDNNGIQKNTLEVSNGLDFNVIFLKNEFYVINENCFGPGCDGSGGIYGYYLTYQRYNYQGEEVDNPVYVNSDTGNFEFKFAKLKNEEILVSWFERDTYSTNICSQILPKSESAKKPILKINDDIPYAFQGNPDFAIDNDKNIVTVFEDDRNGNWDIYSQKIDSQSNLIGSSYKVNDDTTNSDQLLPSVSFEKNGNYMIGWIDNRFNDSRAYVQVYSMEGEKIENNIDFGSAIKNIKINSIEDKFIVTCSSNDDTAIFSRLYSNKGNPISNKIQVTGLMGNIGGYIEIKNFDVQTTNDGKYFIYWKMFNNDYQIEIRGQLIDTLGNKVGPVIQINKETELEDNNENLLDKIIIIWQFGDYNIYTRIMLSSGEFITPILKVNENIYDYNLKNIPEIYKDENNNFIAYWDQYIQIFTNEAIKFGSNKKIIHSDANKHGFYLNSKSLLDDQKIYVVSEKLIHDYGTNYDVKLEIYQLNYIITKTENNKIVLIDNYLLSQNYPNPFNPTTKIKYSIPENVKSEKENVKLIVFDVLGKEIKTLVNENKSPGNYEVEFNASYLSSGIYFYKIQAGKFIETKKMILIK
ncbi:MAG: T9SS type A sorting domain-containing protein [Ignavibacteriae bacterium]|nr:T9SS type A sorting domain-containing protein [Ignavibacteriota bacterium]